MEAAGRGTREKRSVGNITTGLVKQEEGRAKGPHAAGPARCCSIILKRQPDPLPLAFLYFLFSSLIGECSVLSN